MTTSSGRNVRVEIALTFGTTRVVTALTNASTGVATSAAHTLANNLIGYWQVDTGMVQLDQQASRVKNITTDTFELQSQDTTDFSTWVSGGQFTPAATWGLVSESVGYSIGGGAATALDDTRLHENKQRTVNGMLAGQNVTLDIRSQTANSAVMEAIVNAARKDNALLWRIIMGDGNLRIFYGTPSLPGESLSVNQLGSGQIQVAVPQYVLTLAA